MINKVIYNIPNINDFVKEIIDKNESENIKKWLSSNLYNYLTKHYNKFKSIDVLELDYENESYTIQKAIDYNQSIVIINLNQKLKNDIEHIVDYLHSLKTSKNISRLSFKDAIKHSKNWTKKLNNTKLEDGENNIYKNINIIKSLSEDYFICQLESKDEFNIEGKLMNHCLLSYYDSYLKNKNFVIWSIRNKNNKPNATVQLIIDKSNNFVTIPQFKGRFNRGFVDTYAARLFYDYIHDNFKAVHFQDMTAFGNKFFDSRENKLIPLSLWKDGGIINGDLNLESYYINQLPRGLRINGNLNISKTQICFLGDNIDVRGNIFAKNSQLSIIDNTVKVGELIYAENSLLISYPEHLKYKIIN